MTIVIPIKLPSWNALVRKTHWTVTRIFNELHEATRIAILQQCKEKQKFTFPVVISICAYWKEKRIRDIDSVCVKPIIDELVESKILPGDDLRYVGGVHFRGMTGATQDKVLIEIM